MTFPGNGLWFAVFLAQVAPLRMFFHNGLLLFIGFSGEKKRRDGAEVVYFCILALVRGDGGVIEYCETREARDRYEAGRRMGCC